MEISQTDPHCSVALSKTNVFSLIFCKLKTNFISKSQLLYMGCPLTRERKQKKNPLTRESPLTGICKYRVKLGGKTGI